MARSRLREQRRLSVTRRELGAYREEWGVLRWAGARRRRLTQKTLPIREHCLQQVSIRFCGPVVDGEHLSVYHILSILDRLGYRHKNHDSLVKYVESSFRLGSAISQKEINVSRTIAFQRF